MPDCTHLCRRRVSAFLHHLPPELSVDLSRVVLLAVLIDAILRNGGTAAPQADHVPPPSGWADEDFRSNGTRNVVGDEKKSYTEDQRQGVLR